MNNFSEFDLHCMQQAIIAAQQASSANEVPVGAIIALNHQIIATGYNQPISNLDPTAHAEIIALRNAATVLNNYRLVNTTMYVTLEPCPMCIGAMIHARIQRLVYGTKDPKTGACGSTINLLSANNWNHDFTVEHGLCATECATLLQDFFRQRR